MASFSFSVVFLLLFVSGEIHADFLYDSKLPYDVRETNRYELDQKNERFPLAEDPSANRRSGRKRRDVSTFNLDPNIGYTVEVLIVLDESMKIYHNNKSSDIDKYVLSLMSNVADIFARSSIGNRIDIAVVGIEKNLNVSIGDGILGNFREFMQNEAKKRNYDVGLLLTRESLGYPVMGRAYVGKMCSSFSYAVVHDYGPECAKMIAHELGHLLNAPHDWKIECSKYQLETTVHIMDKGEIGTWSPCSRELIKQFLEDEKGSCLLNKPETNLLRRSGGENTNPSDGGWSDWKISGKCTQPCGGGVQWYARECNSPIPKNDGRYCTGRHRMYESCNTHNCPVQK